MLNKISSIIFMILFVFSVSLFTQEKEDSTMNHKNMKMHDMEMMQDSSCKMMDHKMMKCDSTAHGNCKMMECTDTTKCSKTECKMDHKKMDHSMTMNSNKVEKESIVHDGVIDLEAIDVNKDGKVFQDMMDYNVISDKPGKCPLCGMKLKEVSLKKAKDTLIKSGFKVKE